jgi:hypothetical protein
VPESEISVQNPRAYLPLKEFWEPFNPWGFDRGTFVLFTGYMDESYDGPKQNLFVYSCLVARGKDWAESARSWKLQVDAKNKALKKAGRPLISRYHASDCSGRRNEFNGWSHDERDDFVRSLFGVIERSRGMHSVAYSIELDDLCEVFPGWADDRLKAAYGLLPRFVMYTVGKDLYDLGKGSPAKVTLFHDRTGGDGKHDPTILRAFNTQMNGAGFRYKDYFTTIAPLAWEDCVPLQPADLVAFEYLKKVEAEMEARKHRKSFQALIDMEAFGIHLKTFNKEILTNMRLRMDADNAKIEQERQLDVVAT